MPLQTHNWPPSATCFLRPRLLLPSSKQGQGQRQRIVAVSARNKNLRQRSSGIFTPKMAAGRGTDRSAGYANKLIREATQPRREGACPRGPSLLLRNYEVGSAVRWAGCLTIINNCCTGRRRDSEVPQPGDIQTPARVTTELNAEPGRLLPRCGLDPVCVFDAAGCAQPPSTAPK